MFVKAKSVEDFKRQLEKKFSDKNTTKKAKKKASHANDSQKKPEYKQRPVRKESYSKAKRIDIPAKKPLVEEEPSIVLGKSFKEIGLNEKIIEVLDTNKFTHCTSVQEKTMEHSLQGKNIICASETGSGKTLAFVLPMLQRFLAGEINQSLILTPTREIAIQIQKILDQVATPLGFKSGLVIGGTDMREQKEALRDYPPILVATPGRLIDMMSNGLIWLQYTQFVALDEADRMLDMGFEKDLIHIHQELPGDQQTLLFTATLLPSVEKVALNYAKDYEKIIVGDRMAAAKNVRHSQIKVSHHDKYSVLKRMLQDNHGKIIVFFNTIKAVKDFTTRLRREGLRDVECIHSGKEQEERQRTINSLRSGEKRILLATDVAARGIDIPKVELVINYDVPNNPEEYIHRIGRTGRAGYKGEAKMFVTPKDGRLLQSVENILEQKVQEDRF